MRTGERRQQRGMGVHDPAEIPGKELRAKDFHKPRGYDEIGSVSRRGLGQRGVPPGSIRKVLEPNGVYGHAGGSRDLDSRAVTIDTDGDNSSGVVAVRRIQQRAQQ
jgi:hypothetical protein